jgi:hypothetical protein
MLIGSENLPPQENARILTPSAKKVSNRLLQIARIRMIALRECARFCDSNQATRQGVWPCAVGLGFGTGTMMSDSERRVVSNEGNRGVLE